MTNCNKTAKKDNIKDCKPAYKFIHPHLKEMCAYANMAGGQKYDDWNFLYGHDLDDLLDAMERHIDKIRQGEWADDDATAYLRKRCEGSTKIVTHLGCVLANVNMILHQLDAGTLKMSGRLAKLYELEDS